LNLKENGILKTINFTNIVSQLNLVTEVIEGSSGGTISDIQLKNLNKGIENLKDKLNNLELDINKYIDETELTEALKDIKLSLENIVKPNDLNSAVNNLVTSISTLTGRIETLENREIINTDDFVKNNELDNKVEKSIKSGINKIESKFLENSKDIIKDNVNSKVTELVGNIDTKINDKVEEKLNLEVGKINNSINEKTNDKITENTLNTKLYDYAKLNKDNEFTNNNTFKKIFATDVKSNSLNSNEYKLNDVKFIDNDNTFSIGISDKDINLISKGKLLLNGVEFKSGSGGSGASLSSEQLDEINTKIETNKNKITELSGNFINYLPKTDFTTQIQSINQEITDLKRSSNASDIQNLTTQYNSLNSSVSSLYSQYSNLYNQYNNLGSNYVQYYTFRSLENTVNNMNNTLSSMSSGFEYVVKSNTNNSYSQRNNFEENKLYVGNTVVRPVKTIFEGKMSILSNSNGGTTKIEKFNYSSYVSGYAYNCIMFYVCDDNLYGTTSRKFTSWNGGIRGIIDTYLMPKDSVFVSNQYVENDVTKSFRVMVDDREKVIIGFYNGLNYALNITKIVIF
jgi:probable serine/threonine-protein kinase clkA